MRAPASVPAPSGSAAVIEQQPLRRCVEHATGPPRLSRRAGELWRHRSAPSSTTIHSASTPRLRARSRKRTRAVGGSGCSSTESAPDDVGSNGKPANVTVTEESRKPRCQPGSRSGSGLLPLPSSSRLGCNYLLMRRKHSSHAMGGPSGMGERAEERRCSTPSMSYSRHARQT